jgi:hypothetical protein
MMELNVTDKAMERLQLEEIRTKLEPFGLRCLGFSADGNLKAEVEDEPGPGALDGVKLPDEGLVVRCRKPSDNE